MVLISCSSTLEPAQYYSQGPGQRASALQDLYDCFPTYAGTKLLVYCFVIDSSVRKQLVLGRYTGSSQEVALQSQCTNQIGHPQCYTCLCDVKVYQEQKVNHEVNGAEINGVVPSGIWMYIE